MFIISYNVPFDKVDEYVEKLQINDVNINEFQYSFIHLIINIYFKGVYCSQ